MASRLKLHEVLCETLGSRNVYYNPPASVKMKYPAIVYSRSGIDNKHANNAVYNQKTAYDVTVVDPDPDSVIVEDLSKFPLCRFVRHYTADNLNHDVFTLYY
jgi:hypothetical protein